MSQVIHGQIYVILASLCCGMALMLGYDLLRCWRFLVPHGSLWIWIEDILYWSCAAVPVFILFFYINDGILRWHGLIGLPIGAVLYELGISQPIRQGIRKIGRKLLQKKAQHRKRISGSREKNS